MKKLSVDKLKPGMVLEKAIMTRSGQSIAPAGKQLTAQLIARFSFYKIPFVFVTDASVEGPGDEDNEQIVEIELPIDSQNDVVEVKEESHMKEIRSYSQKLQTTPEFHAFQNSYSRNMVVLRDGFQCIIDSNEDSTVSEACNALLKEAEDLFASKTSLELFDMIHTLRAVDDSIYAHCLNVALISRAIGKWLHMSRIDLDELTLAGLLHDIGKV